jgi:hypothetical protein
MPYTKPIDRVKVDHMIGSGSQISDWSAGDLTYGLTRLSLAWLQPRKNYLSIATVIGCLVCTILELYRRVAAPYEDTKIVENGDVY